MHAYTGDACSAGRPGCPVARRLARRADRRDGHPDGPGHQHASSSPAAEYRWQALTSRRRSAWRRGLAALPHRTLSARRRLQVSTRAVPGRRILETRSLAAEALAASARRTNDVAVPTDVTAGCCRSWSSLDSRSLSPRRVLRDLWDPIERTCDRLLTPVRSRTACGHFDPRCLCEHLTASARCERNSPWRPGAIGIRRAVGDSDEDFIRDRQTVRITSVAALGGLLFGYDSAVINNAVSIEGQFAINNFTLEFRGVGPAGRRRWSRDDGRRMADRIGRIAVMKIAAVAVLQRHPSFPGQRPRVHPRRVPHRRRHRRRRRVGHRAPYIAETSPPIRGRSGLAAAAGDRLGHLPVAGRGLLARPPCAAAPARTLWLGLEAWRWMFLMMMVPAHRVRRAGRTDSRGRPVIVANTAFPEARKVLTTLLGVKNLEITIDRASRHAQRGTSRPGGICASPGRPLRHRVGWPRPVDLPAVRRDRVIFYSRHAVGAVGFDEPVGHNPVITSVVNIGDDAHRDRADRQDRPETRCC